jgi:hypothetical protein
MKDFLIKIKSKSKSFVPPKKTSPHVYWNNLLAIFSIVIVVLILFSLYLLNQIKNHQMFQVTPATEEASNLINEKLLDRVNTSFTNNGVDDPEIYKDPSVN